MKFNYAWENLHKAVDASMQHQGNLQDRLQGCYACFNVLKQPRYLPPDLQSRFDAMIVEWTRESNDEGAEKIPITLGNMSDDECRKWLTEILSLYEEVVERRAKEKA